MIEYDFGSSSDGGEEPKAPAKQDASAQWSLIIYSLLRSRRLAVNCGILGAIMGFVQGALQPNVYQSSGKLLVRAGMREASTAEVDPLGGGIRTTSSSSGEAVNTELHLLANPKILREVARRVGGRAVLKMRDPTKDDGPNSPAPTRLLHEFQAWWFGLKESDEELEEVSAEPEFLIAAAANTIGGRLRSVASFGSTVIDIAYRGQTPEISQQVVDAFLEAATIHHREVFTSDPQLEFLKKQVIEAQEASDAANSAWDKFKIENQIYDLAAQKASIINDISALEKKIADDHLQKLGLLSNLKYLDSAIESEDLEKVDRSMLQPNPEFSRLRQELSAMRSRKMDLVPRSNETLEESNARKKWVDDEIHRLESEMDQVEQWLPAANPRYAQLVGQRDVLIGALSALDGPKEDRLLLLESYKMRRDALQKAESEYMHLMLKADQALAKVDANYAGVQQLAVMNLLDEEELGNLRILQKATDSRSKLSPDRPRVLMMGGILGVVIGVMLAFARGLLDPLLRRPGEVGGLGGGPILGVVKDLGKKYRAPGKSDKVRKANVAELTNGLWSHLTKAGRNPGAARISFTALSRGAGVSTVVACAGLGLALRLRERVIIIETDFENPGLADSLDLSPGPGLSGVLAGTVELEDAIQPTGIPGLSILDAGQEGHPGPGWYASERAQELIKKAQESRKFILFDLAPQTVDPESRLLLWGSDLVVSVACAGKTRKDDLRQYLNAIRDSRIPILGTVVNRYRSARPIWLPGMDREMVVSQPTAVPMG